MIFQVAGPHFGDPAAQIWQKGVPQPVRLEFHDLAFHFLAAGALFGDPAAQIWPKGVQQPVRLEFHDLAFHFLAAEPLFVLPAFWILQKGVQQHLISDFYLFPCAGPLFQPWAAEILQKRGAATWHLCSSHFGFNLLFLWRRESALLLCKRIPLRHYSARAWTWPPLLWRETGLLLLLIGFSLSTAGPLFQPWAAEILQKGAPQPDVKCAAIWFFSVPLPHTEAVPPSALSVPALCACRLVRVAFFSQIPFPKHCSEWALPSTPFTPGWPSSVGREDGSSPKSRKFNPAPDYVPFFPAGLCLQGSSCSSSWGKVHCFFARGSRWR